VPPAGGHEKEHVPGHGLERIDEGREVLHLMNIHGRHGRVDLHLHAGADEIFDAGDS